MGANQVQKIRNQLSKLGATLVIGKNTVIRKALNLRQNNLKDAKDLEDREFY